MSSTVYHAIRATNDLPSPSDVALRVLELAQDEAATIDEIAAVVELDPAIASRMLQLVNSPLAGMRRRIVSVRRAAALLGVRAIANLVLGFSLVSENRWGRCSAFNYELFWSESVVRAVAAGHLADRLKNFAPDGAFTCGLLSQIGRLALATAFPERYSDVLDAVAAADPGNLVEIESSTFGINHNELAAEMMADWRLPAIFCEAVRAQDAPDAENLKLHPHACQLAHTLYLTGSIALVLTQRTVYRDTLSVLAEEAARQGIDPYVCYEMLDAISEEWRDAGSIFSVETPRVRPLAEIYDQAQERQGILEEDTIATRPAGMRES